MGRKPKELKKEANQEVKSHEVEKEVAQEVVIETNFSDDENRHLAEVNFQQSEINRLNTEKAHKDILIKTIDELRTIEIQIRKEIQNISNDANTKTKILSGLDNDIRAINFQISRSKEDFEKANKERLQSLSEKEKNLAKYEAEYQSLLTEISENSRKLKAELQKIADERKNHATEIASKNEWVETNKKNLSALEKDIENRELDLKTEREAFEKERDELKPELARISEIKNENLILLQKLESDKAGFESQKASMESYKLSIDAQMELLKAQIAHEREVLKASEGKLRAWEQGLNDQALELKAREAEAQRMMRRYQLTEKIEK